MSTIKNEQLTPENNLSSSHIPARRLFLKGSLVTATIAATASTQVFASSQPLKIPAGIIYTKDNPGKWAKKTGGHVPRISISGNQVTIKTKHGMSRRHYIVRHTLVSHDGQTIGAKTFSPDDEDAISSFTLPAGYKGKLYATSFCNKHDMWLNETQV